MKAYGAGQTCAYSSMADDTICTPLIRLFNLPYTHIGNLFIDSLMLSTVFLVFPAETTKKTIWFCTRERNNYSYSLFSAILNFRYFFKAAVYG